MKRNKLIKVISTLLLSVSFMALNLIVANAEWKKDSNGWWYTEDSTYATGWRVIDGKWYYFYSNGYMAHDTVVDGYYVNNSGCYSNRGTEIQAYTNALKDISWLKNNGIVFRDGKSYIEKVIVLDIDQDGILEMIIYNGTCSADYKVSVFNYSNGKIQKLKDIETFSGGYLGYSPLKKIFFVSGGNMDNYYTDGYMIDNNQCINSYLSTDSIKYSRDNDGNVISYTHNYTINNKKVSENEYNSVWSEFGNIIK
ncbi:hypothetical protein [Clostridium butyricum]|uniref:hypothetical protein n=1 Tax=Clostridium butyricum TaxID=1492 RepID=UPI002102C9E0|nr:hypothetical protein [Clostridium butyricum]MCQ2026829.1 hypothetical protein [Clostridium butyricum]